MSGYSYNHMRTPSNLSPYFRTPECVKTLNSLGSQTTKVGHRRHSWPFYLGYRIQMDAARYATASCYRRRAAVHQAKKLALRPTCTQSIVDRLWRYWQWKFGPDGARKPVPIWQRFRACSGGGGWSFLSRWNAVKFRTVSINIGLRLFVLQCVIKPILKNIVCFEEICIGVFCVIELWIQIPRTAIIVMYQSENVVWCLSFDDATIKTKVTVINSANLLCKSRFSSWNRLGWPWPTI